MIKKQELTEQDYKEFFEWILEKEVDLDKSFDYILCSTCNEPYIYYPKEIKKFLETKPMQRLKKVTQLGTGILEDSNVVHTRYSHCLGTYNNAVFFYINQFKNSKWKEKIEANNRKVEVLADIMESLRHDDGHNILSHGLENFIGSDAGAHEILGGRFKDEYKETIEVLDAIHPDLRENMRKVTSEEYNLITLREGNVDFDRLDFLARDSLYLGLDQQRELIQGLLEKSSIQSIIFNGEKRETVVYEYEALPEIETFLEHRAENYKYVYTSNIRKALDLLEEQFCESLAESDIPEGKKLQEYIKHCKAHSAEEIDLSLFLSWNDIRYYNELISIATNTKNQNIKELAMACLPTQEGLCNLAVEALDPKNTNPKSYSEQDKEFLRNVRALLKPEHPLYKELQSGENRKKLIVLNANTEKEIEKLFKELKQEGITEEELSSIIKWNKKNYKI